MWMDARASYKKNVTFIDNNNNNFVLPMMVYTVQKIIKARGKSWKIEACCHIFTFKRGTYENKACVYPK